MVEDQDIHSAIEDGSKYVEEYLRMARGRELDTETIKEVLDIYHDFLLLTNWGRCCNG